MTPLQDSHADSGGVRDERSEAWLAAILEATPDAIIAIASNGEIVTANAQAERLFGYARHELVGRPVEMLLPERLRTRHGPFRDAFAGDPRIRPMGAGRDLLARRRDGQEIPVEISLSPLPTRDGLYVVSVIRDVTERRQAEQERARLAAIVAASNDAIIGTALGGAIISWNPAAERLYGYAAAEAIGASVEMLAPPDRIPELSRILGRIRRGETIVDLETVRQTRDGRRLDVALTISPVRDHDGAIIGAATIARDIAERKRAEAALREIEDRFHGAFAAAAIGMALVSPDGRFLQVNRSLCQILGYGEQELLATTFQAITHPNDLEDDVALVHHLLAGEISSYSLEKRYFHKHGSVVCILLSVSLARDELGAPRYFIAQMQDVTRAREAERLRDEFVSTVSHELRTPLTSISGYVDLLLDGAAGGLSGTAERYLTVVQQNSRRLVALVNDLLDMSRIEAGKIDLRREEVDIAAQLHDVAAALEPQFSARRQTVRIDAPADLPLVWADAQRSAQIFFNLLSNAHKYTPEGGSISVTAARDKDAVRIDVADTGIGLSDDEQRHVFTRFFRSSHHAARAERGTGLGLAICRALVELHGGAITMRSAPGAGSVFSVTLPVSSGYASDTEDDGDPGERGQPERMTGLVADLCRVLVIEDDPATGNLIRDVLEREGCDVALVGTAGQAIGVIASAPPDLIALDLALVDGNGWSVLDQLRAAGVALPPVVVASILSENAFGRPLGLVDYLARSRRGSLPRERLAHALVNARAGNRG